MSWNKSKIVEYISKDSELAKIAPPEINCTDKRWWGSSERKFFDYVEKEVEIKELLFFFLIQVYELPLNFSSKEFDTACLIILDILIRTYDKIPRRTISVMDIYKNCLYNLMKSMLEKWDCIKENELTVRGEILYWLLENTYKLDTYDIIRRIIY